jgi:RNA polymerase sigma factor (sigma-70 family)
MAELEGASRNPLVRPQSEAFLERASQDLDGIARTFGRFTTAVETQLDEAALHIDDLPDEARVKWINIAERLASLSLRVQRTSEGIDVVFNEAVGTDPLTKPSKNPTLVPTHGIEVPQGSITTERGRRISFEELHKTFIRPDDLPDIAASSNSQPVMIEIVSDSLVKVNGSPIHFRNKLQDLRGRHFLNVLLLRQSDPVSLSDMKGLGLAYGTVEKSAQVIFSRLRIRLSSLLKEAAGRDMIIRQGTNKLASYLFSCPIDLQDHRQAVQSEAAEIALPTTERATPDPAKTDTTERMDVYMERSEAIDAILAKFRKHQQVLRGVAAYAAESPANANKSSYGIQRYRMLGQDEWANLFLAIDRGLIVYRQLGGSIRSADEAQRKAFIDLSTAYQVLIVTNLRLVNEWAKKYDIEDLLPGLDVAQAGNLGLADAVKRFDLRKGFEFSTYATQWIDGRIRNALAKQFRSRGIPAEKQKTWLKSRRQRNSLAQELGREPTHKEVAEALGITTDEMAELVNVSRALLSLDKIVGSDHENDFHELTPDAADQLGAKIDEVANAQVLLGLLNAAKLSQQSEIILSLYFGVFIPKLSGVSLVRGVNQLLDYNDEFVRSQEGQTWSTEQIGQLMGMHKDEVIKIKNEALERLRRTASLRSQQKLYRDIVPFA